MDPSQTSGELASRSNASIKTILIHLDQIGKIKKLEKWVPHELSEHQKEARVDACISLLNRNKNESFLDRIVTCDEKWILYDNRKRSSQWLDPGEEPKQCPKRNIHQNKLMVTGGPLPVLFITAS